jgi:excisionase family DNA binding protein
MLVLPGHTRTQQTQGVTPVMLDPSQTSPTPPSRLLWRVDQLAAATGLSRSLIYAQIAAGKIETVHIGRACRVTSEAVERFIRDLQVGEQLTPHRVQPRLGRVQSADVTPAS